MCRNKNKQMLVGHLSLFLDNGLDETETSGIIKYKCGQGLVHFSLFNNIRHNNNNYNNNYRIFNLIVDTYTL